MRKLLLLFTLLTLSIIGYTQHDSLVSILKNNTTKGDYVIIEMRLNLEDEFRTLEGSSSSLARVAIYTGNNQNKELFSKGFNGMNYIVNILNHLKKNGWRLVNTYQIKGESIINIHYIIERKK